MASLNKVKSTVKSDYAHVAQTARGAASDILNEGKKLANSLYEDGLKKLDDTQEEISEYSEEIIKTIRKNPVKAVLIAGGVGFLLSLLFKK